MDGIIVVNKEKGWTSHDVCAKLRGVLGQKKIGHTGTLDPDATGTLPVLLGKATKLSDVLTAEDKIYETVMRLGVKTTTLDMSGEVMAQSDYEDITEGQITDVVKSFLGEIYQTPPMYSAIKVDGKKLYELAREGKEIERKSRLVTIYKIEIISIKIPLVKIRVACSKGTYIRTLVDDIGDKLGCFAAVEELHRTRTGDFKIEDAYTLEEIEALKDSGNITEAVLSLEKVLSHLPKFIVDKEHEKALLNGNIIHESWGELIENKKLCEGEDVLLYTIDMRMIGIYKMFKEKTLKPHKMFV